jgi:SpoVK/Ycf46/Vps4 family AAA+-type ATPase
MAKIIVDINGRSVQVTTDGAIWDFRAGDIISSDCFEESLKDKRFRVEGYTLDDGKIRLWLICIDSDYKYARYLSDPSKLYLIERPGYKYKVGDRVRILAGDAINKEATVIAIRPDIPAMQEVYLLEADDFTKGNAVFKEWNMPWFPNAFIPRQNGEYKLNKFWFWEEGLVGLGVNVAGRAPASIPADPSIAITKKDSDQEALAYAEQLRMEAQTAPPLDIRPAWFFEMIKKYKAGVSHLFILNGNIYDWQRDQSGRCHTLKQLLTNRFEGSELVMFYCLSQNVSVAKESMVATFKNHLQKTGEVANPQADPRQGNSAIVNARQGANQARFESASVEEAVGCCQPDSMLAKLEKILLFREETADGRRGNPNENGNGHPPKKVLIIDYAHNLVPEGMGTHDPVTKICIETMERWAKDQRIAEAGSMVILLTPTLSSVAEGIRSPISGSVGVNIPLPDEEMRLAFSQEKLAANQVQLEEGFTPDVFARITSGLTLKKIEELIAMARMNAEPMILNRIKELKQKVLEDEYGDLLKVKVPKYGLNYYGGRQDMKNFMMEVWENMKKGMLRRVPMGILMDGPPGTGKTFAAECWAGSCGCNFAELGNMRSKWVGESEQNFEKILYIAKALAPVIIIEDEADQSETGRDTPNGDTGVSNRLRQMKFKFCSDPENRGKVIWIRVSNRSDLLDEAYRRKGRTDTHISFGFPSVIEMEAIFKVVHLRLGIPMEITDFKPFAERVKEKVYCTCSDIEWMVIEADKLAGRDNSDTVKAEHLIRAIDSWRMPLNPEEVDNQLELAITNSDLRPEDWEQQLADIQKRRKSHYCMAPIKNSQPPPDAPMVPAKS